MSQIGDHNIPENEEIKAEIRNKLQAPQTILTALKEGQKVPDALVKVGISDLTKIKELLDRL